MQINIRSSDLAKLAGFNKYANEDETIKMIINYNDLDKSIYIPKTNITRTLYDTSNSELSKLCDSDQICKLSSLITTPSTDTNYIETKKEIVYNIEKKIITKCEDKLNPDLTEEQSKITKPEFNKIICDITKESKNINETDIVDKNSNLVKNLHNATIQDIGMKRGNIKEDDNLDKIEEYCNIKITNRNDKLFQKQLQLGEEFNINLIGKVDGMCNDMVVETKNRRNRLFYNIPIYEKVQLEAYMFLTDKTKCYWIECYNNSYSHQIYEHDSDLWNKCIENTVSFIKKNLSEYIN